jgi:hypothetical protein
MRANNVQYLRHLRFSIRAMLALMFLVSLGMLVWRASEDARRSVARLAQLQSEIKFVEARLRLDQPVLHQAILHTHEEFQPFDAMRQRSIEHFDLLRRKYSSMEPKGTDVFSLREIPSLQTDTRPAPVIFRLLVPEQRTVWLKFGVHLVEQSVHSSTDKLDGRDLLTDSPFNVSGPFETRLQPGDHTLTVAVGLAAEGSLPVVITLDDEVLLRSSFVSAEVTGTSSSRISAPSQLDFGPQRNLPSLLSTHMNLRTPASGKAPAKTHGFSMWLSDRASSFTNFPGE